MTIIQLICILVMLVSASVIGYYIYQYYQGQKEYKNIEETTVTESSDTGIFTIDFEALAKLNGDTVGWIRISGGDISYPIVQTTDNDFYLTHGFDKENLRSGCIFMDYGNQKDMTDTVTYIYGHNMKDKSMFAKLNNYKEQAYYEANPQIVIYTPDQTYYYDVFSSFNMDVSQGTLPMSFAKEEEYQAYIQQLISSSNVKTTAEVTPQDKIVALMTCNGVETSRRMLYGVLVKIEDQ